MGIVIGAVVFGAAGYWYGYQAGTRATVDATAKKAAESANPFSKTPLPNPLENIKTNPFK